MVGHLSVPLRLRGRPQVTGVSGTEIYCTANNDASLGGLLTVFHTERSSASLTNVQNSLPVTCQTICTCLPHSCTCVHGWLHACKAEPPCLSCEDVSSAVQSRVWAQWYIHSMGQVLCWRKSKGTWSLRCGPYLPHCVASCGGAVQVLSQLDKDAIATLAESFEIDFLSVSYARDGEDIAETRSFLDSLGMQSTKVRHICKKELSILRRGQLRHEGEGWSRRSAPVQACRKPMASSMMLRAALIMVSAHEFPGQ